ncbi:MAG: HD-GYP domain-containing protein [Spirochaetia bacterium]
MSDGTRDENRSLEEYKEPDDVEEVEELEDLDELSGEEEQVSFLKDNFTGPPYNELINTPLCNSLIETMKLQKFPSILITRNLEIIWENDAYRLYFADENRLLPVNLAKDFSPDLDIEKTSRIYTALGDTENGYNHREQLQSIKRNRLTVVANAHFSPVYFQDSEKPLCFQVFFDIVTEEQKLLLQNTFLSLLEASKLKDNDTGSHISRVGSYSKRIAEELFYNYSNGKVTLEFIHNIQFLAPMHDVGKIGTPDDILNKNGPLDKREWSIMKEHTINGAYIMNTYPDLMAKQIAQHHHERWDGNGYPYQIAEDMIPLAARIVSIADVYDALRMKRSYKEPFSHEKSLDIITESKGTQFDPLLIDVFVDISDTISDIYEGLKDQDDS